MTDTQIRYARTVDGVNIGYYTIGEGVPLVLMNLPLSNLQFELGDSRIQRVRADQIRNGTRVVRYDHRGIGVSDQFEGEFSTDGFVQDLEAVVDKLDLQRFFLVAVHSFAYPIALTYAALHPARVVSMAVVLGGFSSEFASALVDLPDAGWPFISETIARRLAGVDDAQGTAVLAEELRRSIDLDGLRRVSRWAVAAGDAVEVESVKAPCLLMPRVSGEIDWVGKARSLASRMENAAVQPYTGTTLTEAEDAARDAITSFFTRGRAVPRVEAEPPTPGSAVILFTDIVSSTELTETMGDAAFRDASRALDAGLRAAIRDAGGVAVEGKLLGDGVLATFGSAAQAIDGARRCLALSAASELGLHMGLHAGDVIREENNVFGGAVNIAARICGLSAPGEILVSDVVRGMARTSAGVVFEDRGEREMKGVGEAVRVYAVREQE